MSSAPPPTAGCHAVLPCAGAGLRAGGARPKQYQLIAGEPLVRHTVRAFEAVARVERILVVLASEDDGPWSQPLPARVELARIGGATRAESVLNGLCHLLAHGAQPQDWVLVHDAARCLITPALIDALIDACWPDPSGGLLALPCPDTIKTASPAPQGQPGNRVSATLPRGGKWLAQTPQMFRLGALRAALQQQAANGFADITDEASAMERAGSQPLLVRGSAHNFKVTWPEDFALAEAVLQSRCAASAS
ncbi:MAG: 2-C-methyl-D-erythritol 4-phosphate cytidylyltransferase [Burkholderiaceae bacterium]|jgi:2-C-methyl-D-erythritol 4-phosphate cytidylyltransferase|nr:2-C-methyl-D-erythritol 4-phosphate cytidylyltransferase [Burkholderiaceae bacterium]